MLSSRSKLSSFIQRLGYRFSAMKCTLKPIASGGQFDAPQAIPLPDQEPVILGRSPLTGIMDKKLSRQHVELTANYSAKKVQVKQIGPNPANCHGNELEKGTIVEIDGGDKLQLLTSKYEYLVHFSSKSSSSNEASSEKVTQDAPAKKLASPKLSNSTKKRTLDDGEDDDDDNANANGNAKPATKKMKVESSVKEGGSGHDIDQRLAALQRKAEEAEQKRESKKLKVEAASPSAKASSSLDSGDKGGSSASSAEAGKPSTEPVWREDGKIIVLKSVGVKAGSKIVGFDMDGTLITTASGKVFPQSADDWKILYPEVPGKLKKLHAAGYKVVIFTNQLGVSKGKLTVKDLRRKLTNVQRTMGVPILAFAATAGGMYRKPSMGMWEYMVSKENDGIKVDMKASMFVGDAAGRPVDWAPKKKKDFSNSDRLFALNLGLAFKTPEEFFMGHKPAKFNMPVFDPRTVSTSTPLLSPANALPGTQQEVILLVGCPASGKSTFVKNHLSKHKYVHVNRDTMGTWQKCVSACSSALSNGQSVVVDNTNGDMLSRKRYVDCAKKAKVPCRCFTFTTTFEQAKHNEKFRQLTPAGKNHASISEMIFNTFRKNFAPPRKEEGFSEIVQVNFVPSFINAKEEKLYRTFLLEK